MHHSGVTNDIPAQYHPPRTKGQRRLFPFKASKNQLAYKKGGKKGGEKSQLFRVDRYFMLFPPYPKCKRHQNISTELKQELRLYVYGGNKSKLQGTGNCQEGSDVKLEGKQQKCPLNWSCSADEEIQSKSVSLLKPHKMLAASG